VLLLERIERRVLSDRQIIMQAVAAGVDVDLPDVQSILTIGIVPICFERWESADES
jgi:hypothetical protein